MKSVLSFWLIWRGHVPALDLHNPGQDSSPALWLPFTICFWQGVWGYVSLFAHNEKRWSRGLDRGHAVITHPSESWHEPSVTGRLLKIIRTLGYTESWEVALANAQCSSPHQTDVPFCSQLCCLKKFLLSAQKRMRHLLTRWSLYEVNKTAITSRIFLQQRLWDEAVAGKNRLFLIQKTKRERRKERRRAEKENADKHVREEMVVLKP